MRLIQITWWSVHFFLLAACALEDSRGGEATSRASATWDASESCDGVQLIRAETGEPLADNRDTKTPVGTQVVFFGSKPADFFNQHCSVELVLFTNENTGCLSMDAPTKETIRRKLPVDCVYDIAFRPHRDYLSFLPGSVRLPWDWYPQAVVTYELEDKTLTAYDTHVFKLPASRTYYTGEPLNNVRLEQVLAMKGRVLMHSAGGVVFQESNPPHGFCSPHANVPDLPKCSK